MANFRQVQAVNFFTMPEVTSSSYEFEGVLVYLVTRNDFLKVSADATEKNGFLDSLGSDDLIVSLRGWQFDRHEIVMAVAGLPQSRQ